MKKLKIFITIILISVLVIVWNKYQKTNMNIFTRAEYLIGNTEFSRDNKIKYSNSSSYKLKSDVYNDAMLYTSIDVKPNTVYKVSCMVRTNNVIPKAEDSGAGAFICLTDSTEQSIPITGTNDWQLLELKFNSKNREDVEIGFRLGGNRADCTGEAWFSDFKIEEGVADTSTNWNFGCFIIKNLDVEIENNLASEKVQISMTDSEISNIKLDIDRFEKACSTLSNNKMTADCEIIYIDEPITSLTYEEETGYFVSSNNVEKLIDKHVQDSNYDHIFVIVKLDSEKYNDTIEIQNWVGLGYMDYQGIGFSNIRIPSDSSKLMYIYDSRINTFPEEVFIHEFLHSLERTSNEYGFDTVDLHDYEKYGYKNEALIGLKKWYSDYMKGSIYDSYSKQYIGLNEEIYSLKPANREDFKFSTSLDHFFKEPSNIIEEIRLIINKITNNLTLNNN